MALRFDGEHSEKTHNPEGVILLPQLQPFPQSMHMPVAANVEVHMCVCMDVCVHGRGPGMFSHQYLTSASEIKRGCIIQL